MAPSLPSLSTCRRCQGTGCGLVVVSKEKLCAYCARKTALLFDPDQCEWCKTGFQDISPYADGGILKKILRDGQAGQHVMEGCPTTVQYIGRLENGNIFDTTRDIVDGKHVGGTDDGMEFQLGREKVIQGWDIGIATMTKGELARFIIKSPYAYGSKGFPPKVEPGALLDFEIELVSFKEPLPRFPSQAELAESRKQREEELKRQIEESPPPTIDERITNAMTEKEKGNELVASKKYEEARKAYDSGFVHIFIGREEWNFVLSDEERKKINAAKLVLHLNRALCKLKLGKADDSLWDCDKALEIDPKNIKGYFRRGLVYTEKLKCDLEKEMKGVYWDVERATGYYDKALFNIQEAKKLLGDKEDGNVDKAFVNLHRHQILLKRYTVEYQEEQKKLFKEKIIEKMDKRNKTIQQMEKKSANEMDFDDMPPLE